MFIISSVSVFIFVSFTVILTIYTIYPHPYFVISNYFNYVFHCERLAGQIKLNVHWIRTIQNIVIKQPTRGGLA